MTNLEWIADNKDKYLYFCSFCECAHVAKYGEYCGLVCKDCGLRSNADAAKALMEEHEEKNDEQV